MKYEYLHNVEDLIEAFSNHDVLDKGDLFYAIREYEDFKNDNPYDEIYFEIDEDGDYAFLTEEEYHDNISNTDADDEYVLSQNKKIYLKDELIRFLSVRSDESLVNLALAINDVSKDNTLIPIFDGVEGIELDDIISKVAPTGFRDSVKLTIKAYSKEFKDDDELNIILLKGSYTSLIGFSLTSVESLVELVDEVSETL